MALECIRLKDRPEGCLHLSQAVWPDKNRQIFSLEKWMILTHIQKFPKNVGDLDKLIVAKGFEKWPKVQ